MSSLLGAANRAIAAVGGLGTPLGQFISQCAQAIGVAGASGLKSDAAFTALFGNGALGNVVVAAPVANFDGLRDYESLVVNAGVTVTPGANKFTFIRARSSITFNGIYAGNGVFTQQQSLIALGGPSQSGGGGGGGGGGSATNPGDNGQGSLQTYQGGAFGYNAPVFGTFGTGGAGGSIGNPGNPGTIGTLGTPGTVNPDFQNTSLSLFQGIIAAMGAIFPGVDGADGGNGGNGGSDLGPGGAGGAGGAKGLGGASGGFLCLVAPTININGATFNLAGAAGTAATDGSNGGDAGAGTQGGGGGGGGGGSGGGGGNGGVVLCYYHNISAVGVTLNALGGLGGAGGGNGLGGAGDGGADAGGIGLTGGQGAAGSLGFLLQKQTF